jgi:hypothetical protein
MTPGILLSGTVTEEEYEPRTSKRQKLEATVSAEYEDDEDDIPSHPLEVKPTGNAYSSEINSKASAGFFARLPDELLLQFLEALSAQELLDLGASCRFLYAFTHYDELWRALFVE